MARTYAYVEIDLGEIDTGDLIKELKDRKRWDTGNEHDRKIIEAIQEKKYDSAFELLFERVEHIAAEDRARKYSDWLTAKHLKEDAA